MTSRTAAVGVWRLVLPLSVLVTSQFPANAQTELLRFGPDGGPVPLQAYGISVSDALALRVGG